MADAKQARAWLVHCIVECANCPPQDPRKQEYLNQADAALVAYEKTLAASSVNHVLDEALNTGDGVYRP